MCSTIYVAADRPLVPPYSPRAAGLIVRELPAAQAAAVRACSRPHVHVVAFEGTCGCEFLRPQGRPRRPLVWLLEWALQAVPEVELFVCGPDREDEEPTRRDWVEAAELRVWHELDDGMLLVVHGDVETGAAPAT